MANVRGGRVDSRYLSLLEQRRRYDQHLATLYCDNPTKAKAHRRLRHSLDVPMATRYRRPLQLSDDGLDFVMHLRDRNNSPKPQRRNWLESLDPPRDSPEPIAVAASSRLLFHKIPRPPPKPLISDQPSPRITQPKPRDAKRPTRSVVPPLKTPDPPSEQKSHTDLGDPLREALVPQTAEAEPIGDVIQEAIQNDDTNFGDDFEPEGDNQKEETEATFVNDFEPEEENEKETETTLANDFEPDAENQKEETEANLRNDLEPVEEVEENQKEEAEADIGNDLEQVEEVEEKPKEETDVPFGNDLEPAPEVEQPQKEKKRHRKRPRMVDQAVDAHGEEDPFALNQSLMRSAVLGD
jgi:hypothetical protein